jgi:hypothetical protein
MIRFSFILLVYIAIFTVAISCNNRQKSSETVKTTDTLDILKRGDSITTQVQKVLLENVMLAIKSGGPAYAVTFCNEKAMPLTDSMAKVHNCLIQRVSDKYRNPDNKPTATDSDILAKLSSSNPMKPVLVSENGNMVYYKPIKIAMPACLKCHGSEEKDIDLTAIEIIRQKYPNDLATGYKEGDLRGLWKITFLSE